MNKKILKLVGLGFLPLMFSSCYTSSGTGPFVITWRNYDGTILEIDKDAMRGTLPSYDGATPTREDDDQYTYTWSGWEPRITLVDGPKTYTATYSKQERKVTNTKYSSYNYINF